MGYDGAVLLAGGDAGFEDFQRARIALDGGQGVDLRLHFHALHRGQDALEEDVVGDQDEFGLAVGEDVQVVVRAERRVDGHMNHARKGQGHVDEVPLWAVG